LRQAARRGRNTDKLESSQTAVAGCYLALALQYVHFDDLLVIGDRCKYEALLRRYGRVAIKELGEQTSACFDAQRKRDHVQEDQVLNVSGEHAYLNGRADSNDLVGVDLDRRFTLKDFAHAIDDYRGAGLTAHEQDLCYLFRSKLCVGNRLLARFNGALDQIDDKLFKLRSGESLVEVFRTGWIRGDKG